MLSVQSVKQHATDAASQVHQSATQTLGKVRDVADNPKFNLGTTFRNTLIGGAVGGAAGGALLLSKISLPLLGKVTSLAGVAKFAGIGGGIGLASALLPVVMPSINKHPLIKAALTGTSIGATIGCFLPFVSPIFGAIAGAAIGVAAHLIKKSNVSASFHFGSGSGDWWRGSDRAWNRTNYSNQYCPPGYGSQPFVPPGFHRRGVIGRILYGDGLVPNRSGYGSPYGSPYGAAVPPMMMPYSPSPFGMPFAPTGMLGLQGAQQGLNGFGGYPMGAQGAQRVSAPLAGQPASVQPVTTAAPPAPRKVAAKRKAKPKVTPHAPARAKSKAKAAKPKPKARPKPRPLAARPTPLPTPAYSAITGASPYGQMSGGIDPRMAAMYGMNPQMGMPSAYGMNPHMGMPANSQVNVLPMLPGMMPQAAYGAMPQSSYGAMPQGYPGTMPQGYGMDPSLLMGGQSPYGAMPQGFAGSMLPGMF